MQYICAVHTTVVNDFSSMSDIVATTERSLALVAQAMRALEHGNASTGYELFGQVKRNGISTVKETQYLLKRVKAVEKYYRELEDSKTRRINELYNLEQATTRKKEETSRSIRLKQSDLQKAKQDLTSAEEDRTKARKRRDEANSSKRTNIALAVGFSAATLLTLGLASPITVPGVVVCTANAMEASIDEGTAERTIDRCTSKIRECNREIADCRKLIRKLDSELVSLSQRITTMKSDRNKVNAQRGELTGSIKYLHDVLKFWNEFSQIQEHGTGRADLLQKLSAVMKVHNSAAPRGLSKVQQSCTIAWGKVEEKLEQGSKNLFSIDYSCHFCGNFFHGFPHLSYGHFSCTGCYTIYS